MGNWHIPIIYNREIFNWAVSLFKWRRRIIIGKIWSKVFSAIFRDVYIIGGIVDHNRLKKITYDYAIKHKIRCRKLPMDGVRLKASVHLAVNHIW